MQHQDSNLPRQGLLEQVREMLRSKFQADISKPLLTAIRICDNIQERILSAVDLLDRIEHLPSYYEDAGLAEKIIWELRTILTPEQDEAAKARYEEWVSHQESGPSLMTYRQWYNRYVKPPTIEPPTRERFDAAYEYLVGAGHEDVIAGLRIAWRGAQNDEQQHVVATMAEQIVASLKKG